MRKILNAKMKEDSHCSIYRKRRLVGFTRESQGAVGFAISLTA